MHGAVTSIAVLLVMFKPNPAPMALLFTGGRLVRGQMRRLGISLAGVATGAAAEFGLECPSATTE